MKVWRGDWIGGIMLSWSKERGLKVRSGTPGVWNREDVVGLGLERKEEEVCVWLVGRSSFRSSTIQKDKNQHQLVRY